MLTPQSLVKVSEIFNSAFGKPLDEEAYNLWLTIFNDIHGADFVNAAFWLAKHREKSNKVTPGEMRMALKAIGVNADIYKPTNDFESDPVVKILNSRYEGEIRAQGVNITDFLATEKLGSWTAAMEEYGDHPSPSEQILDLVMKNVTKEAIGGEIK